MAASRTRRSGSYPECRYEFDGDRCSESGGHFCEPRAGRVVSFFSELLVHTKGTWARRAFELESWQEHEIIRPLFGHVTWSDEYDCYVRQYRIATICLGRKNGKTELAAGIVLYLLVGDDEESAEVYGAAKDTKQAGKVFEPAWRMVQLSPTLSKRLKLNKHSRRIYDEESASYYEIITSDAMGELGHNPHGFVLDEVLSQPNDSLWNAMRTAAGTRAQPLMVCITTETNDPFSFGAQMIDEAERIQRNPSRAPHIFAYVRKAPADADPWDEANWSEPNPALGSFLSLDALREEALEARNQPSKENAFRQFRLNQRVQQSTRWLNLEAWDASSGLGIDEATLRGHRCYGGLDLASTTDVAALCWVFPEDEGFAALWRFWIPEDRLKDFDARTAGQASVWVREGRLTTTPGNVIDYDAIIDRIDRDAQAFDVAEVAFDRWGSTQLASELHEQGLRMIQFGQGFASMSAPTKEWERLILEGKFRHGGNPVMRWMVDNITVRTDPAGNIKIDKQKSTDKVDGAVAAVMALDRALRHRVSVYENQSLGVL